MFCRQYPRGPVGLCMTQVAFSQPPGEIEPDRLREPALPCFPRAALKGSRCVSFSGVHSKETPEENPGEVDLCERDRDGRLVHRSRRRQLHRLPTAEEIGRCEAAEEG